jgi:hypothetical protein
MSTSARISVRTARRAAWLAGALAAASLIAACGSAQSSQPPSNQPASTPGPSSSASATPAPTAPSSSAGPAPASPTGAPSSAPVPAPSQAPGAPSTGPSGGAALAACRTSTLLISVDENQAGGTAGGAYYPLNFTNTAATACQMYGYPGVSFAATPSAAGGQIGAAAARTGTFAKVAVRLAPGATAHAWIKVSFAANYPASSCQPVTAHWLRVYPPGETVAGYVGHAFSACAATSVAQLTVLPVRAGQGLAGVTP